MRHGLFVGKDILFGRQNSGQTLHSVCRQVSELQFSSEEACVEEMPVSQNLN